MAKSLFVNLAGTTSCQHQKRLLQSSKLMVFMNELPQHQSIPGSPRHYSILLLYRGQLVSATPHSDNCGERRYIMLVENGLGRLLPAHFMSTDSQQALTTVVEILELVVTGIPFVDSKSNSGFLQAK